MLMRGGSTDTQIIDSDVQPAKTMFRFVVEKYALIRFSCNIQEDILAISAFLE